MLTAANILLAAAVIAGTALALWHMRATSPAQRPPLPIGIAHGAIGATGLLALLIVMNGPPRAVTAGAGHFATMAAVLLGLALLAGIAILFLRRGSAVTIAIHAGLAICGYVLFLAWISLG